MQVNNSLKTKNKDLLFGKPVHMINAMKNFLFLQEKFYFQ